MSIWIRGVHPLKIIKNIVGVDVHIDPFKFKKVGAVIKNDIYFNINYLKNLSCIAFIAKSDLSESTKTEIFISDVDIILIFILFSYNASNMSAATPGLFAIPTPTIDILLKFSL